MSLPTYLPKMLFVLSILLVTVIAGCQNQIDSPTKETPTAQSKEVTVEITGMSCEKGCAPRARDALATLPWAKDVQVHFDRKQATFVAETARYDESAIIAALEKDGFGGTVVK